jgi:uncharacterized protein YndB with AHSA1/START domain
MIYVTVERTVRRRPEIVWDFLTDVSSLAAWAEGIVEATVAAEPKNDVGMTIDLVRRTGRTRAEATAEVTAWRPPSLLALETRLPGLLLLDRATLAPHPEGTALGVYTEIVYGSALTEFFARPRGLLGASPEDPAVQGIYERSIDALVKRIEAMSAVPYR